MAFCASRPQRAEIDRWITDDVEPPMNCRRGAARRRFERKGHSPRSFFEQYTPTSASFWNGQVGRVMGCVSPVSVSWKYALRKGFEHLPVYGGPPTFFPGVASNPRGLFPFVYVFAGKPCERGLMFTYRRSLRRCFVWAPGNVGGSGRSQGEDLDLL